MTERIFKINPNFRLNTPHMAVAWHIVDSHTLQCEAAIERPGRHIFRYKQAVQVMVEHSGRNINLIYTPESDFEVRGIQKWLRELFRDIIYDIARDVLPKRVAYWQNEKGLYGKGVEVKRMKKSVLACCSHDNVITLQPFLALFKQDWIDEIILHEMAHYRFKHHRKSFWDFLSGLLGYNSKEAKAQKDIELSPYYDYCLFLTKN